RLRPARRPHRGSARGRDRGPRVRDRVRDLEPQSRRPGAARLARPSVQPARLRPAEPRAVQRPRQLAQRTLIPDGTAQVSFQGTRIASDFWVDLGHPDAAAYTVDVLTHLVRRYDVDGLHLDRIRYPDISISGQTPSTGTSTGYNETNVSRFNRHY